MIKPKIGKDVIESLTLSMYDDARFVYREYIQNAADQIDKAVKSGLFKEQREGKIEIDIDSIHKEITIKDNATGIESNQVLKVLGNIAESKKEIEIDKGFRGIGRLGGLGYCKALVFETSFEGEEKKSIFTWDACRLKKIIDDRKTNMEAADLMAEITDFNVVGEKPEARYFKVILKDVHNLKLLDVDSVREYLSMVAPVPFPNIFTYKSEIYKELAKQNISIDEYSIYINTEQLFKAYKTDIYSMNNQKKKKFDSVLDIDFFEIKNDVGEKLAWCWYSVSKFEKQIPERGNCARGLRLRKGNIQIGSDETLVRFHKEQRGNFYFLGEVHALHHELIPNARRDYFRDSDATKIFEKKLKSILDIKLKELYRDASKIRSAYKTITGWEEKKIEYDKKCEQGLFSNKEEKQKLEEELDNKKKDVTDAKQTLERLSKKAEENRPLQTVYKNIVNSDKLNIDTNKKPKSSDDKPKFRTQKLSKLNNKKQKFLSKVFGIIDKVLTPDLAENLKSKIEEEFL